MGIYFNNTTPTNFYYNGAEATLYYNGEQIWPQVPQRLYSETLLWSGDVSANASIINLSQHPSAFDSIKIMTWGKTGYIDSIHPTPIYTDWLQLSAQKKQEVVNGCFRVATTSTIAGRWCFDNLTGCNTQQWKLTNPYSRDWYSANGGDVGGSYMRIREVWGINYGL